MLGGIPRREGELRRRGLFPELVLDWDDSHATAYAHEVLEPSSNPAPESDTGLNANRNKDAEPPP